MTQSISADQIVSVRPSVVGTASNALSLNAVMLTQSATLTDPLKTFGTLAEVKTFFGATSDEAKAAAVYFAGFEGSLQIPSALHFAKFGAGAVPATVMDGVAAATQNWALFMTIWEPNKATKQEFADWAADQNSRYGYVMWDSDAEAIVCPDSESLGKALTDAKALGVCPCYPDRLTAAFICGIAASIDFTVRDGRTTFAFRQQPGLTAQVTDGAEATNLICNGYNFIGAYSTANERFTMLQPGSCTGIWAWMDSFVNQIYLNSELQRALLKALISSPSIPYNTDGYAILRAACLPAIQAGIDFGSIRKGIPLSSEQAATVNQQAGMAIDGILTSEGWYLQILPATPAVRGERKSPPMSFWFTDGGSVQQIQLASIQVQ